ncbi:MAG: ribosomal protein S18-alanine N-acetyltransferase [Acidobacteria bacterium]|nr:ribosomal protein S18-alanine N-acetyltransferase [Acidobacteriota bacterium]
MAVMQKIREILSPEEFDSPKLEPPVGKTKYRIIPLDQKNLEEVIKLNLRCFSNGENYTEATFKHLLTAPNILGYRIITTEEQMVGFIFVGVSNETIGHITTIGIAPEHRKRGLAKKLLEHAEKALRRRNYDSAVLEVRVGNYIAQNLYHRLGYTIIQKINRYYTDGEDAYLMAKAL